MTPAPAPARTAETIPDSVRSRAVPTYAPIPSGELLRGQRMIEIDHEGQRYRLQATRQGKLILTK